MFLVLQFFIYLPAYVTAVSKLLINVLCIWNIMAHMQKPDFVFWWNRRVNLNRQGAPVQSTTGSRHVYISGSNGSNAGYTMFQGSVKGTGYTLNSPASRSISLPCVTVCHHISIGLYYLFLYLFLYDIHVHHSVCVFMFSCVDKFYIQLPYERYWIFWEHMYVCIHYNMFQLSRAAIVRGCQINKKNIKDGNPLFTNYGWSGQKKHVVVY